MGSLTLHKTIRFIQFIGLSQAVFWSAPSTLQNNQGLKFPDAVCPCIPFQECPKIYGSVPEDKDLGTFPPCQVNGYIRCCGLSSRRDARALNEHPGKEPLGTSSTTYTEKYHLPPGIVAPVAFVYPEYIDSRKTVKVSNTEVPAPLVSRPPLTPLAALRPLAPLAPLAPPPKLPPAPASVTTPETTSTKNKLLAEITNSPVQNLPVGIHAPPVGFMYPEYLEEIKRKETKDREEEISRKKASLQDHSTKFEPNAFPISTTNSQTNLNTPGVNNIREYSVSFQDHSQKQTSEASSATVHDPEKSPIDRGINGNQASSVNTQDPSTEKTPTTFPIVSASFEIHSKNEPVDTSQGFGAKNKVVTGVSRKPSVSSENQDFGVASLDTVREIIASENALTKPDRIPEIAPFSPRRFPPGVTPPPLNFMYPEYVDLRKAKQENQNFHNFENTRIPIEQEEPEHIEIQEEEITPPTFEFIKSKNVKSKLADAPVKSVEPLRTLPVDIRKPLLFQTQNHYNTFQSSQLDRKPSIETTPTENKTSTFSTLISNTLHNLRSSVSQLTSGISMNPTTTTSTTTNIPPTIVRSQTPLTNSVEIQNVKPPQATLNSRGESEVRTSALLIFPKIPVKLQTVKQHESFTKTTKSAMLKQELSEIPQEKGFKNVVVQAEDVALISERIPQRNSTVHIRLNAPMTRPKEKLPQRQGQSFVRNRGNVKHSTSTISKDYSNARVIPQRQGVNVNRVREPEGNFQPRLRLPARSFESLRVSQAASSDENFSVFNSENIPERLQRPSPSLEMPSQGDTQTPQVFRKHTAQHSGDGNTSESQRDQNSETKSQTKNNNHETAGIFRVTMTIGNPEETLDRLPVVPTVPVTVEIIPSTAEITSSVPTAATTTTTTPVAPIERTKAISSTTIRPPGSQSMRNIQIRRRPQYFPKKHESVRRDSIMPVPTLESKVGHLAGINRHDVEDPEVQESLTFLEENKVNFGSRVAAHQPTKFTSEGSGATRDNFPRQRMPSETFTHDESVTHPNGSGVTKPVDDINVPVIDAPLNNKIRNIGEGPRRQFRRMMLRRRPNIPRDSNRGFPADFTKIEPQSGTDLPKENDSPSGIQEEKIQTNQEPQFPNTPTLNRPSLETEEVTLLPTLQIADNLQAEQSSLKEPASEESAVLPPRSSNIVEGRPRFRNVLRNPLIVKEETTVASIVNISNSLTDNDEKYFIRRRPRLGRRTTTPESPVEASTESFVVGRRIIRRRPGVANRRRTLQDQENENINVYEEQVQPGNSESVRQRSSRRSKADGISVRDLEESETGTSLMAPETGILKINNTVASTGPDSSSSPDEELINVQQEERMEMSSNSKHINVNLLKVKEQEEAGKSSNEKRVVYETATSISVVRNGRVLTLDEVKLLNASKKQQEFEDHVDISDTKPSTLISFDSAPLTFSKMTPAKDHGDSLKTPDSGNDGHQISKPTTPASGTMDDEILETTDKGSNESGPIEGGDSASKKIHKSEETTKEYHENLVNQDSIDSLEKTSMMAEDRSVDLDSVKPEVPTENGSKKVENEDVDDVSITTRKKLHKQLTDVKDDEKILSKLEENGGDPKQLRSWDDNDESSGTAAMRIARNTIQDLHQMSIFQSEGSTHGSLQEHNNLRMNDLTPVNITMMESVTISPDDIARPGRISVIGPIPPGFKDIAISPEEELSLDLPNLDGAESFRSFSEPWKSISVPLKVAVPSRIEPLRPVAKNLPPFKASPLEPFRWL